MTSCIGLALKHDANDVFFYRHWPTANDQHRMGNGHRLIIWYNLRNLDAQLIKNDVLNKWDPYDFFLIAVGDSISNTHSYGWWENNSFSLGLNRTLQYLDKPKIQIQVNEAAALYTVN